MPDDVVQKLSELAYVGWMLDSMDELNIHQSLLPYKEQSDIYLALSDWFHDKGMHIWHNRKQKVIHAYDKQSQIVASVPYYNPPSPTPYELQETTSHSDVSISQ